MTITDTERYIEADLERGLKICVGSKTISSCRLLSLPTECLIKIFDNVPPTKYVRLMFVCTCFRDVIKLDKCGISGFKNKRELIFFRNIVDRYDPMEFFILGQGKNMSSWQYINYNCLKKQGDFRFRQLGICFDNFSDDLHDVQEDDYEFRKTFVEIKKYPLLALIHGYKISVFEMKDEYPYDYAEFQQSTLVLPYCFTAICFSDIDGGFDKVEYFFFFREEGGHDVLLLTVDNGEKHDWKVKIPVEESSDLLNMFHHWLTQNWYFFQGFGSTEVQLNET